MHVIAICCHCATKNITNDVHACKLVTSQRWLEMQVANALHITSRFTPTWPFLLLRASDTISPNCCMITWSPYPSETSFAPLLEDLFSVYTFGYQLTTCPLSDRPYHTASWVCCSLDSVLPIRNMLRTVLFALALLIQSFDRFLRYCFAWEHADLKYIHPICTTHHYRIRNCFWFSVKVISLSFSDFRCRKSRKLR